MNPEGNPPFKTASKSLPLDELRRTYREKVGTALRAKGIVPDPIHRDLHLATRRPQGCPAQFRRQQRVCDQLHRRPLLPGRPENRKVIMEPRVKIVVVRPGQPPKQETIDNTYEATRDIIGGYIQTVEIGSGITLVCDEDGMSKDLPQNGWGILGTYLFTKYDPEDEDGNMTSLTDREAQALMAEATARRAIRHHGDGITIIGFEPDSTIDDMFEALEDLRKKNDPTQTN